MLFVVPFYVELRCVCVYALLPNLEKSYYLGLFFFILVSLGEK